MGDEVLKETADIISEKERGLAKMVGDFAKLRQQFNEYQAVAEMARKEQQQEMVAMGESFSARVEELEQLVETMRFTEREELCARIETWKDAYKRVCLDRDEIEEDLRGQVQTKDGQIFTMAEDNNLVNDAKLSERIDWVTKVDEAESRAIAMKGVMEATVREKDARIRQLEHLLARTIAEAQ